MDLQNKVKLICTTLTIVLLSACSGGGDTTTSNNAPNTGNNTNSAGDGLTGTYYQGVTQDGLGNIGFDGLTRVFTRTDAQIDFWDGTALYRFEPVAGFGDNYSVEWKGFIRIETAGDYGFGTISDDGSEVWIDGNLVVNNAEFQYFDWEDNISEGDLPGETFPVLILSAGFHEITVRFFEVFALDGIELWWLKPGSGPSSIPYFGTNFNDVAPVANANTNWEIVPGAVLYTAKPVTP
ncbi:MAG: hypothetical protein GXP08_04305 [Gammaproteobacteria bacterium]|nr:hypothetical protein [Gammaproteobacteria bacterium]